MKLSGGTDDLNDRLEEPWTGTERTLAMDKRPFFGENDSAIVFYFSTISSFLTRLHFLGGTHASLIVFRTLFGCFTSWSSFSACVYACASVLSVVTVLLCMTCSGALTSNPQTL